MCYFLLHNLKQYICNNKAASGAITQIWKKGATLVHFRCNPDDGSDKCAKLFFLEVQKENIIEKIITRCYVTGENGIVMVAKF